MYGNQQA